MTRRFVLPALLGLLLGTTLCAGLIWVDNAAAQTTTTTEPTTTTTTTEPPATTTTTLAPPESVAPEHVDVLGDPQASAWLVRLLAFAIGVVIAR